MTNPPLDGPQRKVAYADQDLALLHTQVTSYIAEIDRSIVGHFERETSEYVFRVVDLTPTDPDWGVLIGQIVHNLRSALDNAVWQRIEQQRGTPKPGVTGFPIKNHKAGFEAAEKGGMIDGLSADDRAEIERAQPYHHGLYWHKRHRLAILHQLSIVDKHRFLHTTIADTIGEAPGGVPLPDHPESFRLLKNLPPDAGIGPLDELDSSIDRAGGVAVPLNEDCGRVVGKSIRGGLGGDDDPTEILRVTLENPGPNPQMKMEPKPAFEIVVRDPEWPIVVSDLFRINIRVKEVLAMLGFQGTGHSKLPPRYEQR